MASSETYNQYLKPPENELLEVHASYEELGKLLKSLRYHNGGFYILNGNKVFYGNEYQDIWHHIQPKTGESIESSRRYHTFY